MRLIHLPGHTARSAAMAVAALCVALVFVSCEDAEQPAMADVMTIFAGDDQFSKIGTKLAVPLTVNLLLADGTPAQGFGVEFRILSGGGTLSNSTDTTDDAVLRARVMPQPWFMWVAYNAPHRPLHVPPDELHSRRGIEGEDVTIGFGDRTDSDGQRRLFAGGSIHADPPCHHPPTTPYAERRKQTHILGTFSSPRW